MSFTRDGYANNPHNNPNVIELAKAIVSFNGGLGVTYKPKMLKGVGFRVAVESFVIPNEDITLPSEKTTIKTNATNTYLGVEYQF